MRCSKKESPAERRVAAWPGFFLGQLLPYRAGCTKDLKRSFSFSIFSSLP